MLEEIRKAYADGLGVRSAALRRALEETPRERFLGAGPWTIATFSGRSQTPDDNPVHIYSDVSVALDADRNLYNGAPSIVAAWIDALDLHEGDRVFHLGGATGYYTALMAQVVGPRGQVLMAEVDQALGSRAREALADRANVEVVAGDGASLDPGPRDAILIHAGVSHPLPIWLERLNDGGRLLAPLTIELPNTHLGKGAILKVTRQGPSLEAEFLPGLAPVIIFSCTSARDASLHPQLEKTFRSLLTPPRTVRSVRVDRHEADSTCCVHGETFCLSTCPPGV